MNRTPFTHHEVDRPGVIRTMTLHGFTEAQRPEYTPRELLEVVAWLNGEDFPLVGMVAPENDPFMARIRARAPF